MPNVTKVKYDEPKQKPLLLRWYLISTEYFDDRIMTGKVFPDLYVLGKFLLQHLKEYSSRKLAQLKSSQLAQSVMQISTRVGALLMLISALRIALGIFKEGLRIWRKYYTELLLTGGVSLFSLVLLIYFFIVNKFLFFSVFIPLLFFNSFCLSIVYSLIDKQEKGEHPSFSEAIAYSLKRLSAMATIFFFNISALIETLLLFLLASVFLSFAFEYFHIVWQTSILFWLILFLIGVFTLLLFYWEAAILPQIYYFALLEKQNPIQSFINSIQLFRHSFFEFHTIYSLLIFCAIPFSFWTGRNLFEEGFAFSLLCFVLSVIFFSYLLRNSIRQNASAAIDSGSKPSRFFQGIFIIVLLLGIPSYILFAVITVKIYPTIAQAIGQQIALSQDMSVYSNADYTIDYPKTWNVYKWNGGAITLYNNYTGEEEDRAIWATITSSPLTESPFEDLRKSNPGIILSDDVTKDVASKISDITINRHEGVKYSLIKHGSPFTEYQTHYLIRNKNIIYEITFTARNEDLYKSSSELFEQMATSFRFL